MSYQYACALWHPDRGKFYDTVSVPEPDARLAASKMLDAVVAKGHFTGYPMEDVYVETAMMPDGAFKFIRIDGECSLHRFPPLDEFTRMTFIPMPERRWLDPSKDPLGQFAFIPAMKDSK
jgi:hypothetical protein